MDEADQTIIIHPDDMVRGTLVETPLSISNRVAKMEKALRYLADNPGAHPVNVQVIAKDALGEG